MKGYGQTGRGLFFLVFTALAWVSFHAPLFAAETHYEGWLERAGDRFPIRLHVEEGAGENAATATLDAPLLWYAGENASFESFDNGRFKVTFPFGIGEIEFTPHGKKLVGQNECCSAELRPAKAAPYSTEEITFGAFDPKPPATLYLPKGKGPHPAIILVGGSSRANRSNWVYRSPADYFARLGLAVLIYDRREEDAPLADGRLPDLETDAKDVLAGVELLKQRKDIDAAKIGLFGASRGVWISAAAAAQTEDVSFLIWKGVPAVSPAEQEVQRVTYKMLAKNRPETEIAEAINYLRLYFYVVESGTGWELLRQAATAAADAPWGNYVDQPETPEDLDWWSRNYALEPRDVYPNVHAPVLALWGADDTDTPPLENQAKLIAYVEAGGDKAVTHVYPRASHRVEVAPWTDENGQWHWFQMAPGMFDDIETFLKDTAGVIE